jgi:hypothetical protein
MINFDALGQAIDVREEDNDNTMMAWGAAASAVNSPQRQLLPT